MTTPKINTTFRGGSRFYIHPGSGEKVPGVTSVLNMLPKPFLKAWAGKEVATTAVRSLVLCVRHIGLARTPLHRTLARAHATSRPPKHTPS